MGYIISLIAVVVLVGLDQWSKIATIENLKNKPDINVIEGVF